MTPSPIRAENQRVPTEMPASTTARPAMISAMRTIWPAVPCRPEIRLTMSPASRGVITPMTAETTVSSRKNVSSRRYGRAMPRIRFTVPLGSSREVTDGSRRKDRIAAMEVMGLLMSTPPPSVAGPTPRPAVLFHRSVSATTDELGDPPDLRRTLGRVLGLRVVADGGADQLRRRPARSGRGGGERGDEVGHRGVELGSGHDQVGQPDGRGLRRADRAAGQADR